MRVAGDILEISFHAAACSLNVTDTHWAVIERTPGAPVVGLPKACTVRGVCLLPHAYQGHIKLFKVFQDKNV